MTVPWWFKACVASMINGGHPEDLTYPWFLAMPLSSICPPTIYVSLISFRIICATVCFAVIGVHVRRVVSSAVARSRIIIHVSSVSIVVSKF